MDRRRLLVGALAMSGLWLAGCRSETAQPAASSPVAVDVQATPSLKLAEMDGYSYFVRATSSDHQDQRRVLVFFDPLCSYCREMWDASRDVDVTQIWIPVAILANGQGAGMGAWLLQSPDANTDFDRFKYAMDRDLPVEVHAEENYTRAVLENTKLFQSAGQNSVPLIAFFNQDGHFKLQKGSIPRTEFLDMINQEKPIQQGD